MLFMVIERFRDHDMVPIYRHLRDKGRKLPDGLEYIDSWIEPNFSRCFQLMRCAYDQARFASECALVRGVLEKRPEPHWKEFLSLWKN